MQNSPENIEAKNIFVVNHDCDGQRLDNFIIKTLKNLNKSNIYKLLRKGQIRVNGKRSKPLQKLIQGDKIRVPPFLIQEIGEVYIPEKYSEQIRNSVVFENPNYMIVNKPSGMPVHSGTSAPFGLIDVCQKLFPTKNLQLAHRLDKETSGCVVLTKSRTALNHFNQQKPVKKYFALVKGRINDDTEVTLKLDTNHREEGEKTVIVSESGKEAKTMFRVSERYTKSIQVTLMNCQLFTGRTHQIRVHAAESGFPLVGDKKYGDQKFNHKIKKLGLKRMFLHAASIEFDDIEENVVASAELPNELEALLNKL